MISKVHLITFGEALKAAIQEYEKELSAKFVIMKEFHNSTYYYGGGKTIQKGNVISSIRTVWTKNRSKAMEYHSRSTAEAFLKDYKKDDCVIMVKVGK